VGRAWWVLGAIGLVSCAHSAPSWPPSYILQTKFPDHYELLVLGARYWDEPLLAAGDSLHMQVRHDVCHNDSCAGSLDPLGGVEWSTGPATRASITNEGWLRALRAGDIWVRARHGDTVLTRKVRVLPPVATLAWIGVPPSLHVGDTLRLRVAAYDSSGRRVAYLPRSAVGEILRGDGQPLAAEYTMEFEPEVTSLAIVRPGRTILLARLVHRSDTLVLHVTP
jgi:hypothetical protein